MRMPLNPLLLTLGYGKRSIDDAIQLLQRHDVQSLVDVRSSPWSRYHPDFAQDALESHLEARGIAFRRAVRAHGQTVLEGIIRTGTFIP